MSKYSEEHTFPSFVSIHENGDFKPTIPKGSNVFGFHFQALYKGACKKMEAELRCAYQKSTGADITPEGSASMAHGIVVDKLTGKFMATYKVGKDHGSICKIFDSRADAEFWFDSLHALMQKGRLAGNLAALRSAAATRQATANAINKIMEENITLEPEGRGAYKRDATEGRDFFNDIFQDLSSKMTSGLAIAKIRMFKPMLDQLQEHAAKAGINGLLLGTFHTSLGWRPTVCIILGEHFDKESANDFASKAGLQKLGIVGCSDSPEPTEGEFGQLAAAQSVSDCKSPILLHLVRERFKVSYRVFQFSEDSASAKPQEVFMEYIARRLNGEDVRVLGLDKLERAASRTREAAIWLQLISF